MLIAKVRHKWEKGKIETLQMGVMLHTGSISGHFPSPDLCKTSTNIHVVQRRGYIAVLPSTKEMISRHQGPRMKSFMSRIKLKFSLLLIFFFGSG